MITPPPTPSLSRREFIAGSTSSVIAGTLLDSQVVQARSTGDRELKIALIGCGGRGTGAAAQALSTQGNVKLWAMADAFEENLERSYRSLNASSNLSRSPKARLSKDSLDVPLERRFVGLDAYRAIVAMPEIDLVILTTPPGFRPKQFEEAVNAGKHVFMEKPVASDVNGVRTVLRMAEEAKRRNLKVGVGLNRRHSSMYQSVIKRIQNGDIGRLNTTRIYNMRSGVNKFYARQPEDTEMEYQVKHWYYFDWLSGDFLVEQSVHDYDVALWMKGMLPVRAQGQGGRLVRTGKEWGNIYDHFYVEYDFPDGSKLLSQHRHMKGTHSLIGEFADGSKGSASVIGKTQAIFRSYDNHFEPARIKESGNSYQVEHDQLFRAIREDLPHNEAEYGAHATYAAILGRMAAYTGKSLDWAETLKSDHKITPDGELWTSPAPIQALTEGGYEIPMPGKPTGRLV